MRYLLALFLVGCAGYGIHVDRSTIPWYIDADDFEAQVWEAVAKWEACGVGPYGIIKFDDLGDLRDTNRLANGGPFSVTINNRAYWTFEQEGCNGAYHLPSILLHELGHTAGLDHTSDRTDAMYPYLALCEVREITSSCRR